MLLRKSHKNSTKKRWSVGTKNPGSLKSQRAGWCGCDWSRFLGFERDLSNLLQSLGGFGCCETSWPTVIRMFLFDLSWEDDSN